MKLNSSSQSQNQSLRLLLSALLMSKVAMSMVVMAIGLFGFQPAQADNQTAPMDTNARDPRLQEGQMFVVRLVPAGKTLEVLITGKKAAELKAADLGLTAQLYVGEKVISLTPKKNAQGAARFHLDPIDANASKLKLEIKSGKDSEKFEFNQLR